MMSNKQPKTAVLLAAGRGKRLRPYTDNTPKPLLPVNGRATLDYVLTAVANAGFENVCLVTHYLGAQISRHVGDGSNWGLTAVTCHQPEMLGTAHALQTAVDAYPEMFVEKRPFLLTATDYILPPDYIVELVDNHALNQADITMSLKAMPLEEIIKRSSTAFDPPGNPEGKIIQIIEKPSPDAVPSLFTASLTLLLPAITRTYLQNMTPSPRGEYEIQSIVNQLLADGYAARGVVQGAPPEWKPSYYAKRK